MPLINDIDYPNDPAGIQFALGDIAPKSLQALMCHAFLVRSRQHGEFDFRVFSSWEGLSTGDLILGFSHEKQGSMGSHDFRVFSMGRRAVMGS